MPSGHNKTEADHKQYELEFQKMIEARYHFPSVIMWVVFNEGWGQYKKEGTARLTDWVKEFDPTRLTNNASGWTDSGAGDVIDIHRYPGPGCPKPEKSRASVLGEFGGLGLKTDGHMWSKEHWGYQGTETSEHLTKRYEQLLRRVYWLKESEGLCAAVYTQITDVETETNGLVTYDRKVIKLDEARAALANRGQGGSVSVGAVVPTSQSARQQWRYTFDKPGDDWTNSAFDDATWKQGPGGFGTKDTGGPVGTEWKTPGIWLRRSFDLSDTVPVDSLVLSLWHDDDVIVYLNGEKAFEAGKYNISYEEVSIAEAARKTLKPGKNQIAVYCLHKDGGRFVDAGILSVVETAAKSSDK